MFRDKDDIDRKIVEAYLNKMILNPYTYKVDIPYLYYGEYPCKDDVRIDENPENINVNDNKEKKYHWWQFIQKDLDKQEEELDKVRRNMQDLINPNRQYERLGVDVLCVRVSENLVPLIDPDNEKSSVLENCAALRQKMTDTYGYIIPNVRFLDDKNLDNNVFTIYVRGKEVLKGRIPKSEINDFDGTKIIEALENICIKYVHQIMTNLDVLKLIELVKSQDPTITNNLVPIFLSTIDLKKIFCNLISQKISIKDIIYIFEILIDNARYTNDVDKLTAILIEELNFVK